MEHMRNDDINRVTGDATITRREFLGGAIGMTVASVMMAGCSTATDTAGNSTANSHSKGIWDRIASDGVLRVGTEGTYSPYSYHGENDMLTGYDIEFAREICARLGIEAEFTEMGFDGLAAGLDAEKFDVVADQICVTEEREKKYLFSVPYAYVRGVVIASTKNTNIKSFDDLDGKKVALTVTSNWAKLAESYGAEIVSTSGFAESMQMVVDERVDATVNDNLVFLDYMAQHPDSPVRIAATEEGTDVVALLMRKGDEDLKDKLDGAIGEMRDDGTLKSLSERYFGEDVSIPWED